MLYRILPILAAMVLSPLPLPGQEREVTEQAREAAPVKATLRWDTGPFDVSTPISLRLEVLVPPLPFEESLESGQPSRYRPEPVLDSWLKVPNFRLQHIEQEEPTRVGENELAFRWTYTFEAQLPGDFTLPALTVMHWPPSRESQPLITTFDSMSFQVASVLGSKAENLDSLKPRSAATQLPRTGGVPRWLPVTLVILIWAAVRYGYWRMRKMKNQPLSSGPRNRVQAQALEELEQARTTQEAFQALRLFLLEKAGVDLAKLSPEESNDLSLLPKPVRRELAPLLEELQPAVYSQESIALSAALRRSIQEFLRSSDL